MKITSLPKRFQPMSLHSVLTIPFVVLTLLAVTVVGYVSFRNGQHAVDLVTKELRSEINTRIAEHLHSFLTVPHRINQINANAMLRGSLNAQDQRALQQHFLDQVRLFESVTSIYFGNTAGGLANAGREGQAGSLYVIATDGFAAGPFRKFATNELGEPTQLLDSLKNFDSRQRAWYEGAVDAGTGIWSSIYIVFTGQDMSISAAQPVYDAQQQLLGVTAVDLFLSHLSSFLADLDIGKKGQSFIFERSGALVASSTGERPYRLDINSPNEQVRIDARDSTLPATAQAAQALYAQFDQYQSIMNSQSFEFRVDDERYRGQVKPFQDRVGLDWLIVTVIPDRAFLAQIHEGNRRTIAILLITVGALVPMGLLLTNKVTQPMSMLTTSVEALARGDWTQPTFPQSRILEIGVFTASVRHMARQLQTTIEGLSQEVSDRRRAEDELRRQNALISSLLDSIPDIVFFKDTEGVYLGCNSEFAAHIGRTPEAIVGETDYELYPKDIADAFRDNDRRMMNRGQPRRNEEWITYPDGRKVLLDTLKTPYRGPNGETIGLIGISRDITERKQIEEQMSVEKERLRTTLLSVGDGVISTDNRGRVQIINKVAEQLTGWTQAEAFGKPLIDVFHIVNAVSGERCPNPVEQVLETGQHAQLPDQTILVSRDGTRRPIEDSAAPIRDDLHRINGAVLVFRDCLEQQQQEQRLEYLSLRDSLTGLYNRRFFDEELRRLDVERNLPLTVMMVDVNGLKLTNDAFGTAAGDALLKRVADILKRTGRGDDIIARIGGDEFAILWPRTDGTGAQTWTKRMQQAIAGETVEGVPVSVSCGWGTKVTKEEEIRIALKDAEDAMYRDKITSRNSHRHESINLVMKTLYESSPRERQHSERVSKLCRRIGSAMGLAREECNTLMTAGLLHDIGKIAISHTILDKKGSLTDSERLEIQRHPIVGYSILSSASHYAGLAEYVLAHHERWDGGGYPNGIAGEAIPLAARIIAIADTYDAMTSNRPYRAGMPITEALEEIEVCSGSQFDPDVVDVFLDLMRDGELTGTMTEF